MQRLEIVLFRLRRYCRGQPTLGLVEDGKPVVLRSPNRWRWLIRSFTARTERLRQRRQQRRLRAMFGRRDDDEVA